MNMFRLIVLFLFIFVNVQGASESNQANEIAQATKMLSFARDALVETTQLAKDEFGIKDNVPPTEADDGNEKYNTAQYRDIFYPLEDSVLVNQAFDYFNQGKKMKKVSQSRQKTFQKVQNIRKPAMQLFSIIYNNESSWTVFTNVGKFTYAKPRVNSINITGISNAEVEFIMPIQEKMKEAIRTLGHDVSEYKERVSVQNRNLVVRLHIGECIFEDELKIITKCSTIVEEIEKQVEI